MAITLIASPQDFTPAYNPCKYIYNSTNKNIDGFRYIFDIYESGTSNKIAEYRVLPKFGDGYGEIDLSKLLSSKVSFDFFPYNNAESDTPNMRYTYDVKVGEEYIKTYIYTANLTNNGGNVKIIPTTAHTFVVGDQVVIDAGVNTLITGLWTVISVTGTTDFTISAVWANVSDPTANGSVTYADKRKTVTRNIETAPRKVVFNGALPWTKFNTYTFYNYLLNSTGSLFMTSCPYKGGMVITPTQELWFNGFNAGSTGRMVFENSNGDSLYYDVLNTAITTQLCVASPNLPLNVLSGSLPLIKDNTTYYTVYFITDTPPPSSNTWKFTIDQRCAINNFHLVFLDRMGSWGSFAFQLRYAENGTVTKQAFNKDVQGYVSSEQWTYDNLEAGLTTYSSMVEKTYTLNTNWMTEEMAIYFQELISSPSVYFWNGYEYLSCQVMDNSFEVEKKRNKNLFKKTVIIKLANQDKVNI
jgi:hypothetical protein